MIPKKLTAVDVEKMVRYEFNNYYRSQFEATFRDAKLDIYSKAIQSRLKESVDSLFTEKPKGFIVLGDFGVGKSSILSIVMREYLRGMIAVIKAEIETNESIHRILNDTNFSAIVNPINRASIICITHEELIGLLRDYPSYLKKRIVCIDDFGWGYEDRAGWNVSLQRTFFDDRYNKKLPTFITTNKETSELRTWEGFEKVVDRVADSKWMTGFRIGGKSLRK